MQIILVHNGGLSTQELGPKLREAEAAGDMEAFQELLRTPLPEIYALEVPGEPFFLGMAIEAMPLSMAPKEEIPLLELPTRHYRDLEYPQQSRRSRIKRTHQRRP